MKKKERNTLPTRGLDAGSHEPEGGVQQVLVHEQAFPRPQLEATLVGVGVTVILEAHARLYGLERANEARLVERMLDKQPLGKVFLLDLGRIQVAHRTPELFGDRERGPRDPFAGFDHERLEVEQANSGTAQEREHAPVTNEGLERASKHEPIESGQS